MVVMVWLSIVTVSFLAFFLGLATHSPFLFSRFLLFLLHFERVVSRNLMGFLHEYSLVMEASKKALGVFVVVVVRGCSWQNILWWREH